MKPAALLPMLAALLPLAAAGAGEPAPKSAVKQALLSRMAESARSPAPAPAKAESAPAKETPPTASPATEAAAEAAAKPAAPAAKGDAAVLPKVEVRKERFSQRDYQLAQDLNRQEQAIERERRNAKASETDRALNDERVARTLSVFGGNSAAFRQRVATERLELLEAEKDLIEQIAIAQKPEEKKELQRQLDELRTMRRQLDQTLR